MKTNTKRNRHSILRRSAVAALAVATIGLGGQVAHAGTAPISEFMNGSFEQPVVAQSSFQNFRSGTVFASCWGTSTAYPGGPPIRCWRVTKGSVDIVDAAYWAADSGRQSVDLNSNEGAGAVRQDVVLKPGAKYHLTFRAAMNPDVVGGQAPLTARVMLRDNSGRVLSTVQSTYSLSSAGAHATEHGLHDQGRLLHGHRGRDERRDRALRRRLGLLVRLGRSRGRQRCALSELTAALTGQPVSAFRRHGRRWRCGASVGFHGAEHVVHDRAASGNEGSKTTS